MRQLKFGVEIEFFGCDRNTIAQKLRDNHIEVEVERYNHNVRPHWKLTTDSSVNNYKCENDGPGNELVSPILYENEGLDELKKVLDILNECGAKVDKSCGIHVHHDINDYEVQDFKNLYNYMYNNRLLFDSLVTKSRRNGNNNYCKPITDSDVERANCCDSINEMEDQLNDRYKTLNISSYTKYGTIEFRQHQGTLDFEKISNWVELTFRVVCYCKNNRVSQARNPKNLKELLFDMRENLDIMGTSLSKYINKRIEKLGSAI